MEPEGSGTEEEPYLIATLDNLLWLCISQDKWTANHHFLQTEDIEAGETQNWNSGAGFSPIGLNTYIPFCGVYNGNNHTISGLFIMRPTAEYTGFFGSIFGAQIESLELTEVNITGGNLTGALAGYVNQVSTISNCFVNGQVQGMNLTGGIIGYLNDHSSISNCCSDCSVYGAEQTGGIIGYINDHSLIANSFAIGNVYGSDSVAGLAGHSAYYSEIYNCYCSGFVSGTGTGGWLAAFVCVNEMADIINCVWNTETSGQNMGTYHIAGELTNFLGVTTEEMQTLDTFLEIGWDFCDETENGTEDIWDNHNDLNNGFPYLSDLFSAVHDGDLFSEFEASTQFGNAPLTIEFINESLPLEIIETWEWDFQNDGTIDSFDRDPVWFYEEPGFYSVNLNAYDVMGRQVSSELKVNYITVYYEGYIPEGSGSEIDPYLIESLENLLWICNTDSVWSSTHYFLQTEDIDASDTQYWNEGAGFNPIGFDADNSFCGNYNGGSNTIDSLFINRPDSNYIGLFGRAFEAVVEDLGLTNVDIIGNNSVGSLVGCNVTSMVSGCFSSGRVEGENRTGGLVGYNITGSLITDSYSSSRTIGTSYTGGLVGFIVQSEITECFATGIISGVSKAGGLTGSIENGSNINNCYATGHVYGSTGYSGGLTGHCDDSSINNCYSIGSIAGPSFNQGGFAGANYNGIISNSMWNEETSDESNGVGGNQNGIVSNLIGVTTAEMQLVNTYIGLGWDFANEVVNGIEDIWNIHEDFNDGIAYISDLFELIYSGELMADFEADYIPGNPPVTVNFIDGSISGSDITIWEWDFENDGMIDSYEQDPVWTYTEQGVYSVSLTVYNDASRDESTILKENLIQVVNDSSIPEGSGTEGDPYRITSLDNLFWLSSNESAWSEGNYYLQTEDIDASETQNWNNGAGFNPIGREDYLSFYGIYCGNGHFIEGLFINRPETNYIGLFGRINESTIDDVHLTGMNITGNYYTGSIAGCCSDSYISNCQTVGNVSGNYYTGGLTGIVNNNSILNDNNTGATINGVRYVGGLTGSANHSTISLCYASGSVCGEERTGGFVGINDNQSLINMCFATGNVTASENHSGGLAGYNRNSTISECYATGNVSGNHSFKGGLTGTNYNSSIDNCYSTGSVSGSFFLAGGLVGGNENSSISYCYTCSTVNGVNQLGGFAGRNTSSSISSCLWNNQTSGQSYSIGENLSGDITDLLSVNTAQMQIMETYTDIGWDFASESINGIEDIWNIDSSLNNGYPYVSDLGWSIGEPSVVNIEITFGDGWNWFSLNISGTDMGLNSVLSSLGESGDYIKSQTQYSTYYTGIGWLGSLNLLNNYSMYKIDANSVASLLFSGNAVAVEDIVYNVNPGWNWISYSPQSAEGIDYALSGLGESASYVKSQTQYASYYTGFGWFGSLTELEPGKGYMLDVVDAASFTYPPPAPARITSKSSVSNVNSTTAVSRSVFNPLAYEFNGSVTMSSEEEIPEQSRIVALCNDEIRGVSELLDYTELLGRKYYALMVYSNEVYEEGFHLFYQENEKTEMVELDYGFVFAADMISGDFQNPVLLTISQTNVDDVPQYTNRLSVFPNPFNPETNIHYELAETGNVLLEIYNIKGQKMTTLLNEEKEAGKHSLTWNAENLGSGIYLLRYETPALKEVRKLILLK